MSGKFLVAAILAACTLLLHRSGVAWFAAALTQGEGRTHLIVVLLAVGGALMEALRRGRAPALRLDAHPLAVGALLASVSGHWFSAPWGFGVVDAGWAWLGLVGLLGVLFGLRELRRAALPLLLVLLALPRFGHLEAAVGFPLRLATAEMVADLLRAMGLSALDAGTVLTVEGQTTRIDMPCSGVRSLWTGAAFLLAATWLDRRRWGLRWLVVAAGLAGSLVLANGLRVLVLVALHNAVPGGDVAGTILHEPLGVLGFLGSCGLAWLGLRWVPQATREAVQPPSSAPRSRLIPVVFVLQLAAFAFPRDPLPLPDAQVPIPNEMAELVPRDHELELVTANRGVLSKARFDAGDLGGPAGSLSGELVLVLGDGIRTQHRPDICIRASGADIGTVVPAAIADTPVRTAEVDTPLGPARAVWWFQSASAVTDEQSERMLRGLLSPEPWLMVSVLVQEDGAAPAVDSPALAAAVARLRRHGALVFFTGPDSHARLAESP